MTGRGKLERNRSAEVQELERSHSHISMDRDTPLADHPQRDINPDPAIKIEPIVLDMKGEPVVDAIRRIREASAEAVDPDSAGEREAWLDLISPDRIGRKGAALVFRDRPAGAAIAEEVLEADRPGEFAFVVWRELRVQHGIAERAEDHAGDRECTDARRVRDDRRDVRGDHRRPLNAAHCAMV